MRTLLILAVVVLLLIVAGVMVVTWNDNRLSIEVDTGKIKQGTQKAVDETRDFLHDARKNTRGDDNRARQPERGSPQDPNRRHENTPIRLEEDQPSNFRVILPRLEVPASVPPLESVT